MSSFYVRKISDSTWSLMEQWFKDGKREQKTVPKDAYSNFGLSPTNTLEEARARVSNLNKKKSIDAHKAAGAARRAEFEASVSAVFMDPTQAAEFKRRLIDSSFSKSDKKLISHWHTIQKVITELQLEPHEFADEGNRILKLFRSRRYSPDYIQKLIRVLNLFGSFVCKGQGRHYEPIQKPRGHVRESLADAYQSKEGSRAGGSKPLTPKLLTDKKSEFTVPGQYEWVFVSFWFGLRPIEVTSKDWKVEVEPDGTQILWVYQSKLTSVPKDRRWKLIPILYEEQKQALAFLQLGSVKRPLCKTIVSIFGKGFGLYAGRKGFADEMEKVRKHSIVHVSTWLGHATLDRTMKNYRNRLKANY